MLSLAFLHPIKQYGKIILIFYYIFIMWEARDIWKDILYWDEFICSCGNVVSGYCESCWSSWENPNGFMEYPKWWKQELEWFQNDVYDIISNESYKILDTALWVSENTYQTLLQIKNVDSWVVQELKYRNQLSKINTNNWTFKNLLFTIPGIWNSAIHYCYSISWEFRINPDTQEINISITSGTYYQKQSNSIIAWSQQNYAEQDNGYIMKWLHAVLSDAYLWSVEKLA